MILRTVGISARPSSATHHFWNLDRRWRNAASVPGSTVIPRALENSPTRDTPGTLVTAFFRRRSSAEVGSDTLRKLTHNRLGSGRAFRGDADWLMG